MKKKQVIGGKYELVSVLGKGGMGTVYRATHLATRKPVALKVLRGEVCADNPELVARFEREARATGRIQSQHIVHVFDTGYDEVTGAAYLAMELLDGEVLSALLRRLGPLHPTAAVRIAGQACLGLGKAHAAGIIHRDIKPPNLFLTETDSGDRVLKILDFGIAKVLQDEFGNADPNDLTRTGNVLGSPHYMSPEQARGRKLVDQRSDIWSLGIVLYKMLTGKTPHHEVMGFGDVIIAICSEPPRPVRTLAPWVTEEAALIVHRALELDPQKRYQKCEEMVEALRRAVGGSLVISADALKGIPTEQRQDVAERLQLAADQPSSPSVTTGRLSPSFDESSRHAGRVSGDTGSQLSLPMDVVQRPSHSRRALAVVALSTMVVGVTGATWLLTHGKAPAPSALGAIDPTATASAIAKPGAAEQRTFRVRVRPVDARVEINGRLAEVKEGSVAVSGAIGSVHEVKLSAGGSERLEKVVLSEAGAVPEEVVLPAQVAANEPSAKDPKTTGSSNVPVRPKGPGAPGPANGEQTPKPQPTAVPPPPPPPKPTGLKPSERFE